MNISVPRHFLALGLAGGMQLAFLLGSLILLGRVTPEVFVEFQSMLALWPWMTLFTLGCERLGRRHAPGLAAKTESHYTAALMALACVAPGLGILAGGLAAWTFRGGMEWAVLGWLATTVAISMAGREALLAQGHAAVAALGQSAALATALLLMLAWVMTGQTSYTTLLLTYALPHLTWGVWCWQRSGLGWAWPDFRAWRRLLPEAWPYALQTASYLMLACLDVLMLRAQAAEEVLPYFLLTRPVVAAFTVSSLLLTRWTHHQATQPSTLRLNYSKAVWTGLVFAGVAACVTTLWGETLYRAIAPNLARAEWQMDVLPGLLLLVLGRSLCEASQVLAGAHGTRSMALTMGWVGLLGSALIAWTSRSGWHAVLWASAAVWATAGLMSAFQLFRHQPPPAG